jgi:hypothetical protein
MAPPPSAEVVDEYCRRFTLREGRSKIIIEQKRTLSWAEGKKSDNYRPTTGLNRREIDSKS